MQAQTTVEPRWLTFDGASKYSGLAVRTLQNYVKAGQIRSSNVRLPGSTRGRRLIDRESLDSFIEAGVRRGPSAIKMNEGRAAK